MNNTAKALIDFLCKSAILGDRNAVKYAIHRRSI